MPEISVESAKYGPTPFNFRLGGNRYFDYTIQFSDTPPATFDYTLEIKNEKDEVARTFTVTDVPVNPDGTGTIHVPWDGSMSPQKVPYGSYRPYISASASGYTSLSSYGFSGGGNNSPGYGAIGAVIAGEGAGAGGCTACGTSWSNWVNAGGGFGGQYGTGSCCPNC